MKIHFFSFLILFISQNLLAQTLKDVEMIPQNTDSIKRLKLKSISDLQKLSPYESVSVIQRRYLPKTFRGQINVSVSSIVNHTFFYLGGLATRLGFFIREDHGIGIEAFSVLPPIHKIVTKEMIGPPNRILPFSSVVSQLYGGVYYRWSPIFGKFAFLNEKIIYFDMYTSIGIGVSHLVNGLNKEQKKLLDAGTNLPVLSRQYFPTGSFDLGQIFALSQNWAVNWELKWLFTFYQVKSQSNRYAQVDIGFSLGINYFFPGASYR